MTKKTVQGEIENAYNNKLETKLSYSGDVEQFSNIEEVRAAGEWPNDKTVLSMVNQRKVAAKRQELIKSALDAAGIKAPTLEDVGEAVKAQAKILLARKLAATEEEAIAKAKEILGVE